MTAHGGTSQRGERHRRLTVLSPWTLALAVILLVAADWGTRLAGDTVIPGGPLDELAHLLSTLLVFWAFGPRVCERFLIPALVASVVIDFDHIPDRLGAEWITAGTPRPYTHSLLTIAVVLAIAVLWRRRRDLLVGIAFGLAIHFWRDMGEGGSGVSILWPISYHSFQYPHGVYVAVMAVFVLIDAARCSAGKGAIDRPGRGRPLAGRSGSYVRTPEKA
ncbi:MAG: metal-dependent hydrolase [Solirubrobacteraceae bacterium]